MDSVYVILQYPPRPLERTPQIRCAYSSKAEADEAVAMLMDRPYCGHSIDEWFFEAEEVQMIGAC